MTRIDRSIRNIAVALVAALLAACSDGATGPRAQDPVEQVPPVTQPPAGVVEVAGTWTSRHIDGAPLPAVVKGGREEGISWELRVLADTLVLRADGTWTQRVRVRHWQSDGFAYTGTYYDRGRWTRSGGTIDFESHWIQNVRFRADVTPEGVLLVHHDFTLDYDGSSMRRAMQR